MKLNSKENIASNLIWRLFERVGAQGVSFIVSIVLARLLDPSVYGVIALVTIFTSILQVFVDSGLGNALIQKKEADDLDFSTVFYFNIFFCIVLYGIMFFLSPTIAYFYGMDELVPVLRVLSLTIVVSGVKNIQQAYVSRHMMFRKFFYSTLGGTIGAAVVGIIMALNGFGVWALVAQNLFNMTVDTVILWITVKWRPQKAFSYERLKELFSYGWKLLVSSLIDAIYEDVRSLIIGKKYSPNDLAFYNRGKQFPHIIVANLNTSIESVLFPSLSMEQDDMAKVRSMTSRTIKTTSYIIFPLMVGLAVCADNVVMLVLSEKWMQCVPYLRIFCLGYAIVPITLTNLNAIKAIGRSDIYLRLEITRKIVNTVSLLVFMWFGPKAIAFSYLLNCIVNLFINSSPNKKFFGYGYIDQIKDLIPACLLSIIMGIPTYCISLLELPLLVILSLQIITGATIYILLSKVCNIESFNYVLSVIKSYGRRRKHR